MIRTCATPLLRASSRCLIRSRGLCLRSAQLRFYSQPGEVSSESEPKPPKATPIVPDSPFELFKEALTFPVPTETRLLKDGHPVVIHGFLGKRRDKGQKLSFYDLRPNFMARGSMQVISSWESEDTPEFDLHQDLKKIPQYSPVCVMGTLARKRPETSASAQDPSAQDPSSPQESEGSARKIPGISFVKFEVKPQVVRCLNTFPKDIIVSKDVVWPPKSRHLQMRFDDLFYERLKFRNLMADKFRSYLRTQNFTEVETPVLFKSTPEGAREFLVPTRRKGFAYALPQSPQQYKQLLMSGGISNYFQFAKCFRDEDHRADRQPEFTQLDLEMSFAAGEDVIRLVNKLLRNTIPDIPEEAMWLPNPDDMNYKMSKKPIRQITYQEAMSKYGIDKPDLRITPHNASDIINITDWVPPQFTSMITSLKSPIVEACKFRFLGSKQEAAKFIGEFFDTLPNTTNKLRGDSTPAVLFFDVSKPLQGLSALEHEAAQKLTELNSEGWPLCEDGNLIIIHARENQPFQGGSTELGRLRKLIYDGAVERGLLTKNNKLKFAWVTEFPLFSPNDEDPGQGGSAGFKATHHPFTSPLTPEDVDLLRTDPLKVVGDHYDLVLNGVEVGGGSRRIHVAAVQEYIMRDVLKMTKEGVAQFSHLLEALRAGCPPHAGFALGFDRFMSILCDVPSVKDVLAFPKDNKGEDKLVGSPSKMTVAQQKTYHLFNGPKPETPSA